MSIDGTDNGERYNCPHSRSVWYNKNHIGISYRKEKRMKKRLLLSLLVFVIACLAYSTDVQAAPKVMPDGQIFDAEYYAAMNPDVVAVLGTDEAKLYLHYTTYGKKEGRLPCAPAATAPVATPAPTLPPTNDIIVENADGGAAKQMELQRAYSALPQNVKNFYNKKNVRIIGCTRDYIGIVSDRKSIGYAGVTWDENWNFISAKVYVSGTESSYSPPAYCLYHELAHVLDYQNASGIYSTKMPNWEEMIPYNKSQVDGPKHAFAEAFAGYFERPEQLKKIAPGAYAYVENVIVNMK